MAELIEDDGDVKTEALDNAQPVITLDSSDVSSIASESVVSLTTYQTLDSLPITGLSGGDQAYVRANNRLYISNGLGWYNVSLINLSPRFDSDINSAFSIVDSQTPLIINNPASDSDNPDAIITYGGTMSDSGQYLVALTRDSSVWTFTPLSADSVYDNVTLGNLTDSDGGSFTYSFTASDNINQAVKTITITYDGLKPAIGVVDSSSATVLLMKARNTGSQPNATITYQNVNDQSVTITNSGPTGKAEASKFSPYRDGGYSYYFDGSTGYIQFDNSDESLVPETGDFTLEFWFNTWQTSREDPFSVYTASAGFAVALNYPAAGGIMIYSGNNIQQQTAAGGHFETNVWNHFAMERSGNTQTIYINGQSVVSGTVTRDYSATTQLHIGNAANNSLYYYGWLSDLRFVKGSTVYGGNFTPPTERLTAIANTQLLTCNLPYFGDASTNNRTATLSGTAATEALGPYDYFADSDGVVGSVHIDEGQGQLNVSDYANVFNFGNSDWTVEGWYRLDRVDQQYSFFWSTRGTPTYREILWLNGTTLNYYGSTTGSSWYTYNSGYVFPKDVWHHIATVRNGGNLYIFINGKRYTASAGLSTSSLAAPTAGFIGSDHDDGNEWPGSIADFRIVLGTAVYTSDFVVPTQPLEHISGTTLLMQNKTNANVYDAANGNAIKGEHGSGSSGPNTTYRQFTSSPSIKFNGSSDHYIVPKSRLFDFNTGDFTVEAWLYTSSATTTQSWCGTYYGNGTGGWNCQLRYDGGVWSSVFGTNGDGGPIIIKTLGSAMPANTWVHIAITRDSTGIRMWADGTELGTATANSTALSYYSDLYIGKLNHSTAHQYFSGYIQDLRISKGLARYTSNFTPPTAEFTL